MTGLTIADCIKGLPRKIKIGPYDWSIVLKDGEDDVRFAEVDLNTHTIEIWPDSLPDPSRVVGVVLHECLHVIFSIHDLGNMKRDKEDREEALVSGFELGLISLFRDNPKFMNWLRKWLK